ncbi:MAG: hypothetical protein E6Q68_06470 [Polynucleobacter sp.]|nr:MAG: hypothetical protein E6Q68_06470 [Polynucleobacter sp.]
MAGNRKAAQDFILKYIEKMIPGSVNAGLYKNLFASMTDKDFEEMISSFENEEQFLCIISPNMSDKQINVQRNIAIAKELGHNFFERIWIDDGDESPVYLSNDPYMVMDLPVRRQVQLLDKKISIPEHNRTIDTLTGQPTGASKGSKISQNEMEIIAAAGLQNTLTEFMKYRGGDLDGFNAMNASIARTGSVSTDAIEPLAGTVTSTRTLRTLLMGMHLENSLISQ